MSPRHNPPLRDPDRHRAVVDITVALDNGMELAESINPDGTRGYWILSDDDGAPGCDCAGCAPHERTGALPIAYRGRVNRCGAPTRQGRPCANPSPPGTRCAWHHEPDRHRDHAQRAGEGDR